MELEGEISITTNHCISKQVWVWSALSRQHVQESGGGINRTPAQWAKHDWDLFLTDSCKLHCCFEQPVLIGVHFFWILHFLLYLNGEHGPGPDTDRHVGDTRWFSDCLKVSQSTEPCSCTTAAHLLAAVNKPPVSDQATSVSFSANFGPVDCLSTRLFLDGPKIAEEFEVLNPISHISVSMCNHGTFVVTPCKLRIRAQSMLHQWDWCQHRFLGIKERNRASVLMVSKLWVARLL